MVSQLFDLPIMNRFPALVRSSDCDLSWQESATRHCSSRRGCVQALHDIIRPDCGSSGDNWPTTARVAHASDQVISPSLQRTTIRRSVITVRRNTSCEIWTSIADWTSFIARSAELSLNQPRTSTVSFNRSLLNNLIMQQESRNVARKLRDAACYFRQFWRHFIAHTQKKQYARASVM